jgi:RNA polymerase sigma-70 factor, ECF subfamily
MADESDQITQLLRKCEAGDRAAEVRLFELVYADLRRIARRHMGAERPDHTLQATALVHEAYLQLVGKDINWQSRSHFFAVAAQSMRRILVDHARTLKTEKRGAGGRKLTLDEALNLSDAESQDLLDIDRALERLTAWDPRQGKIVELRFFGGLTDEEAASFLGISARTVRRDWNMARAWLQAELADR